MKEQITAMLGVMTHPKRTMQELSSTRIYALAILAPLYFGIARAFRPRNHELLFDKLGGNLQIVLLVCAIAAVTIPLGGWLMRQILKLFRKRLSVIKILNINGYAFVPRLAVALLGYVVMFSNPALFTSDRPTLPLIMLIVLGLGGMLYSLFLMIYGYVVTPSEDQDRANQASEATSEPAPSACSSSPQG